MVRGRTRDEAAKARILGAAFDLVAAGSQGGVRIDDIAEAAGVGKQTIYRWWPTRTAVVLDALVEHTIADTPFRTTDDCRRDFVRHLRSVSTLFASPTGCVIKELLGDAQTSAEIADEFRQRFWQPRRDLSEARLRAGIAEGQVRADVVVDMALDALYAPLWVRLLVGHRAVTAKSADQIIDLVWPSLQAEPRTRASR